MNSRKAIHDEIDTLEILNVQDLEHASKALIDTILLAGEDRCLVHLIVVKVRLEANGLDPVRLFHSDSWELFELPIVELAEEGFLDRVEKLTVHIFGALLNLLGFRS